MFFVIAFGEVFVGNAEQRPARNGHCFCVVESIITLCFQRERNTLEKKGSYYGKQTMGRTTTLSSGGGGSVFFERRS